MGVRSPKSIAAFSLVQTATVTSSLGATLAATPGAGNLLVAIGFNGATSIACASGWTAIRHVSANYADSQSCYRIVSGDTALETPFAGTASSIAGELWEVTGQASSGFIDAETGAEGGPLAVTLTFVPSHTGDLILAADAINTRLTGTTPPGFATDASSVPAGTTGFSDLSAHEANAAAGTQSVTWSYTSATDTHPVTADMIAIAAGAPTATPTPTPVPTPTPLPTPTPTPGSGSTLLPVQTAPVTASLGATLHSPPANGDLLIAIGFNGKSAIGCASGWTSIRRIAAKYVDEQSCYRIAASDTAAEAPFSGTASSIAGEIWDIAGQAPSGFIDAETGAESGTASTSLTFTPAHAGDLIVGASAINARLPAITPSAFTSDASASPAANTGFSDLAAHAANATAGSQSVTWAYSSTTDKHPVTAEMIAIYGTAAASPTPSPTSGAGSPDWLTMGYNLQRTGYDPNEQTLGVANVSGLHAYWAQGVSIAGEIGEPVYASGVTVNGLSKNVLYAGSSSGQAVAIDADSGTTLWTHQMSTVSYMCGTSTSTFGSVGAAAIDRAANRLYIPDGGANVHALDLSTGAEVSGWPINIASPANHNFIYSALSYNAQRHLLYAETSSTCDISPWAGRISAIDVAAAAVTSTFFPAQGASGGGIWGFGGASIDAATNNVYVAVGNSDTTSGGSQTAGYSEQVVELTPDLTTVLGHYYAMLPVAPDADFGATPLLFQPLGCPLLAAAINKSGLFVLYNAGNVSAGPTQTIQMSITSDNGDFVGIPAYDPVTNYVYVGLPATEGIYKPGVGAFSMQMDCTLNPTPVWNALFGADGAVLTNDDTLRSPISIANGVLYVSDFDSSRTYAFSAATGAQLWTSALNSKGVVGPIVANGHLYTSDSSGRINAWSP